MNLDELQSVRDRERQTDKLQQLRESFYADAGEFVQGLRERRAEAAERADDPFDAPEVARLSDEIDTAEQTVEAIYEKRVGKIVKAASFAAADLPAESGGMTREERDLFETLVADITANREHVLEVLAGEEPAESGAGSAERSDPDAGSAPDGARNPEVGAADAMGEPGGRSTAPDDAVAGERTATDEERTGSDRSSGNDRPARPGDGSDDGGPPADERAGGTPESMATGAGGAPPDGQGESPDRSGPETDSRRTAVARETVRITADVGAILGVDEREYDLSEDDVVTLPATNAEPLVERDAAERLE